MRHPQNLKASSNVPIHGLICIHSSLMVLETIETQLATGEGNANYRAKLTMTRQGGRTSILECVLDDMHDMRLLKEEFGRQVTLGCAGALRVFRLDTYKLEAFQSGASGEEGG